jgi:hypothetical protein
LGFADRQIVELAAKVDPEPTLCIVSAPIAALLCDGVPRDSQAIAIPRPRTPLQRIQSAYHLFRAIGNRREAPLVGGSRHTKASDLDFGTADQADPDLEW